MIILKLVKINDMVNDVKLKNNGIIIKNKKINFNDKNFIKNVRSVVNE